MREILPKQQEEADSVFSPEKCDSFVTATFTAEAEDIFRAAETYAYKTPKIGRKNMVMMACVAFIFVLFLFESVSNPTLLSSYAIMLICLICAAVLYFGPARSYRNYADSMVARWPNYEVTVTDREIQIVDADHPENTERHYHLKYADDTRILETDIQFVFVFNSNKILTLPKSALSEEEENRVRELFVTHDNDKFEVVDADTCAKINRIKFR